MSFVIHNETIIHSRSGERWATGLAIDCLLVGQHVSNGANSSFWQLPTQKAKTRWATSCASGGLAIGYIFGSPSETKDTCVQRG